MRILKKGSSYPFQKSDFLLELGKEYLVRCMKCGKVNLVKREDIGIKYICDKCKKENRLIEMRYSDCFKEPGQRIGFRLG